MLPRKADYIPRPRLIEADVGQPFPKERLLEWFYKDGELEGSKKRYYKNGQVREKMTYKDGKIEGDKKKYYESGKVQSEIPYKNGKIEGEGKMFYENGEIRYISTYRSSREVNRKSFDENGKLKFDKDY